MDFSDNTKLLFRRIQEIDPENATKVIGFLLIEDEDDNEIIRLAYGPDNIIHSLIDKAKHALSLFPQTKNVVVSKLSTNFTPFTPASSSTTNLHQFQMDHQSLIHNFNYVNQMAYFGPSSHGFAFQNQPQFPPFEDPFTRPQSLHEHSLKFCDYFSRGYCKHGANCKFLHVRHVSYNNIMVLNPPNKNGNYKFSQGYLKKLEVEIIELLKSGGGVPVPVICLPALYYEKYEIVLQAEGKFDFGLVQMIVQTSNNRIKFIQRPNGQQCVILQEDIPRYMRVIGHRDESEAVFANSCQVYLTFPPQSVFNEDDVYNYFNNFGPVHEVRIPFQTKRMFGFVTFDYPETVKLVLRKGNPHFICGARVLVKPYRNKPIHVDRNPEEQNNLPNAESLPSSSKTQKLFNISICIPNLYLNHFAIFDIISILNCLECMSNGFTSKVNIRQINTLENNEESFEEVLNLPDSPFYM